jgi:benzoyl-CoA reductase subunit D
MITAGGIDVGTSTVKAAIVRTDNRGNEELLATHVERIRRRDPRSVIATVWSGALERAGVGADDVEYVATTGDGELVDFRRGHFYSMTTHARGALFLVPGTELVMDVGALHARCIHMDDRAKPLAYRMTSQCASGTGQFLENIARYLGVSLEEVGPLSLTAKNPEVCSSICAVLSETDVINMVSRGISTADILKGIHLSMAGRFARLVRNLASEGLLTFTGGLAADEGLLEATREELAKAKGVDIKVCNHPLSIAAGAIGAGLWGAFRHEKLLAHAG